MDLKPRKRKLPLRNTRIGGYINIEYKFLDDALNAFVLPDLVNDAARANPLVTDTLNGVPPGTGQSARIGRKYTIKSLLITGHLEIPELTITLANAQVARIIVYVDKQTNAALASSTDVLSVPDDIVNDEYLALHNIQNSERFTFLHDKVYTIPSPEAVVVSTTIFCNNVRIPFRIYKKLNLSVTCNGEGATVGSIAKNSIHMIAIRSDNTPGIVNLTYSSRIRFTDA